MLIEVKYEFQSLPVNPKTTVKAQTMGPDGKWTINDPVTIDTPNDFWKGDTFVICNENATANSIALEVKKALIKEKNAIPDTIKIKKLLRHEYINLTNEV